MTKKAKKTDRVRPTSVSRRMGGPIKFNDDTLNRFDQDKKPTDKGAWEIMGKNRDLEKAIEKKKSSGGFLKHTIKGKC